MSGSQTSPTLSQPEPKKQQLSELDAYDKDPVEFVKSFQRTLQNRKVKDALIAILNEAFLDHMKSLEAQVLADQQKIDKLETELSEVKAEKTTLEIDLQDLQQYTRRKALRIYNPSWIEPRNLHKNEQEDTDKLVLELARKLGVQLAPWEIGRFHRDGRPKSVGSPRPVIVKFIGYNIRRRMYEARKELKDTSPGVYINEDLTRENSKLAYEARQLKRRQRILDTFTRNGRVYIRCTPEDRPVVIRDMNELMEKSELSRPQPRPAQEERSAASSSTMSESMFRLPPPMSTRPIPRNAVTSTPSGDKPDEAPAELSRFCGDATAEVTENYDMDNTTEQDMTTEPDQELFPDN